MKAGPASSAGRRLRVPLLLALVVLVALTLHGDSTAVLAALAGLQWKVLLSACGLALGNYVLRFVRWEYFLRRVGVTGIRRTESALVFVAGFVLSITPGKVGELVKCYLLHRSEGVAVESTAPVVIAERLTDFIAVILLCVGGAVATEHGAHVLAWGTTCVALVVGVLSSERMMGFALALLRRLPIVGRFADRIGDALETMRRLLRPAPLFVGVGLGILAWGLEGYALHVVLTAFGATDVGVGEAVFIYTFATLVGAVALLPAGLGVTEGSLIALIQPHVATVADATAITLIIRFCTLWFAVGLGLIALAIRPGWWSTISDEIPSVDKKTI
jgi:uncharacterized protein (TIRG00374 family)